jgi:hypothetical protein
MSIGIMLRLSKKKRESQRSKKVSGMFLDGEKKEKKLDVSPEKIVNLFDL